MGTTRQWVGEGDGRGRILPSSVSARAPEGRALTRARIRAPFNGKIIPLEDNKTIIRKVKTSISWRAA
jgi:hypothetical protein